MGYEWEEAEDDHTGAVAGVAALGIGLLGLAIKGALDSKSAQSAQERERILQTISIKQSRINDLNAKWFPSTAQQQELERLKKEVEELKKKL